MLPNTIELDLAAERRAETVAAERRDEAVAAALRGSAVPRVAPARRVVGRWFMAVGARLAGEPSFRLARSSRG